MTTLVQDSRSSRLTQVRDRKPVIPARLQALRSAALNWSFDLVDYERIQAEVWPVIDRVPGHLSRFVAFYLYQTAKTLNPSRTPDQPPARHVVEIGSFKGRSAVAIGLGLKANREGPWRFFCVDPFFDERLGAGLRQEFLDHVTKAGVAELITWVPEPSHEVARRWPSDQGVAMLWIDGNHTLEYVREDFQLWKRFVVPGGMVAFDDFYLLGVREVVLRDLFGDPSFQNMAVVAHHLVAATKTNEPPTRAQRARKQRMYWALRTGSTSTWRACLAAVSEVVNRPFGHLGRFLREPLPLQRE